MTEREIRTEQEGSASLRCTGRGPRRHGGPAGQGQSEDHETKCHHRDGTAHQAWRDSASRLERWQQLRHAGPAELGDLVDGARVYSLFNPLVDFDLDAHPVLSLADELEASSDAMKWTIRVKPDIEFHNGKTLSADDVLFTFQRIVNPKTPALGAISLRALDMANAKKLDKFTIQIPCFTPFSPLADILASYDFFVLPVGFDLKHPIGTGPFKYESFTAGQQSTFVKNKNYWENWSALH